VSAIFVVLYAGAPLEFRGNQFYTRPSARGASQFSSEVDAWLKCRESGLPTENCECLSLDEALQKEGSSLNAKS